MKHLKLFENIDDKKLKIYKGDDWEGVYYKNELIHQGHSIRWDEVLKELGYEINNNYINDEKQWEDLGWELPQKLDDLESMLSSKKYNL